MHQVKGFLLHRIDFVTVFFQCVSSINIRKTDNDEKYKVSSMDLQILSDLSWGLLCQPQNFRNHFLASTQSIAKELETHESLHSFTRVNIQLVTHSKFIHLFNKCFWNIYYAPGFFPFIYFISLFCCFFFSFYPYVSGIHSLKKK